MERISWKLIALLAFTLAVVACGGGGPSDPDIDATVEARIQATQDTKSVIDATVEVRAKEEVAAQLSATPLAGDPTAIPADTSIPLTTPRTTLTPNPSPHYDKGYDYYKDGKYQLAIDEYTKAIQLDPDDTNAHYNRGRAYGQLGQYKQAIQGFDKAIQLDPDDALAYIGRGVSYFFLEQYQRAIDDYTKAIQLEPDYPRAYMNRGHAYGVLGQDEKADADFDKACSLHKMYC